MTTIDSTPENNPQPATTQTATLSPLTDQELRAWHLLSTVHLELMDKVNEKRERLYLSFRSDDDRYFPETPSTCDLLTLHLQSINLP